MTYKVIAYFTDLEDNNHIYRVGDNYPRDGVIVDKKRFEELMSDKNKQGRPLIKAVREKKGNK